MTGTARAGDDVAIFCEVRVSYELRRVNGGFRLVSDFNLQGLMRGDACPVEDFLGVTYMDLLIRF